MELRTQSCMSMQWRLLHTNLSSNTLDLLFFSCISYGITCKQQHSISSACVIHLTTFALFCEEFFGAAPWPFLEQHHDSCHRHPVYIQIFLLFFLFFWWGGGGGGGGVGGGGGGVGGIIVY